MKTKLVLLVLLGISLSAFAIAETNYNNAAGLSNCKSDEEINQEISACKEQGLSYSISYNQGQNCKIVSCQSNCLSYDELNRYISDCNAKNLGYTSYTDNYGCKRIKCEETATNTQPETNCPSVEEAINKCSNSNMNHEAYVDSNGCKSIRCINALCPTSDELNKVIEDCGKKNLGYSTYEKDGCKHAQCSLLPASVDCKKAVINNCIKILCDDGYEYDSCKDCPAARAAPAQTASSGQAVTSQEGVSSISSVAPQEQAEDTRSEYDKCVEDLKKNNAGIDDEIVLQKCRGQKETEVLTMAKCTEDQKRSDAAIDDEVVWQKCKNSVAASLDQFLLDVKKCVKDLKDSDAAIDDEVVWSKCTEASASEEGKIIILDIQKCVDDNRDEKVSIDDEVVWSKCTEEVIGAETKLAPQPDPPGVMGMFSKMGRFFRGIFS